MGFDLQECLMGHSPRAGSGERSDLVNGAQARGGGKGSYSVAVLASSCYNCQINLFAITLIKALESSDWCRATFSFCEKEAVVWFVTSLEMEMKLEMLCFPHVWFRCASVDAFLRNAFQKKSLCVMIEWWNLWSKMQERWTKGWKLFISAVRSYECEAVSAAREWDVHGCRQQPGLTAVPNHAVETNAQLAICWSL